MLLTLIKALKTDNLDIVVSNFELCPLDIDVLLYEAQASGEVEIDKEKNTIKALKEPEELYYDQKLYDQIIKIVGFYDGVESNITRSKLEGIALDPSGGNGYKRHDLVCTLYFIEENAKVKKYEINMPKKGDRPEHTFTFYTLTDHQKFGQEAVDRFIKTFETK